MRGVVKGGLAVCLGAALLLRSLRSGSVDSNTTQLHRTKSDEAVDPRATVGKVQHQHHDIAEHTKYFRPPSTQVPRVVYVDIGANEADTLKDFAIGRLKHFTHKIERQPMFGLRECAKFAPCAASVLNQSGGFVPFDAVDVYAVEPNEMQTAVLVKFFENLEYIKGLFVERGMWNQSTTLEFGLRQCTKAGRKTKLDLKFTDQVSAFEFGNGTVNVVKKMQGDPAMDFTANSGEKNPKCVQKVQVMDACQFLRQTIGVIQADFVVIKLDVESAEPIVLDRWTGNQGKRQDGCLELIDVLAFEPFGEGGKAGYWKYLNQAQFRESLKVLNWT